MRAAFRSFSGALAIVGLFAVSANAAPFGYMIDAANQIKQIEYSKTVLTRDDRGRIAKIACDALTKLAGDPDFESALKNVLEKHSGSKSAANALVETLSDFNDVFLRTELDYLREAGLQYPVDILQVASRQRTRVNLRELSSITVMGNVQAGKDTVCRLSTAAVTEQQQKAVVWTFTGATLIVVDVAAALTIGAGSSGALAVAAGAVVVASIGIGADAAKSGAKGDVP